MTLGSMMEHQRGLGAHSHHHHHHHHINRDRAGNASPLLSPTHTADIHDFDTRDLTIITSGGIGTTSPSPPLTTSLSPGTSITSSPQHFYPGGRQTDDEEQEYTTAVTEQRETLGTGGSQRQSPYQHQNTGQSNYGNIHSRQFPHHTHTTTSQTPITTHIITQHPTTLPRSNSSKSKSNASNRSQQSDRKSNQVLCRHDWQRSASCRNLRSESRFEKGREGSTSTDPVGNGRTYYESVYRQELLLESPITRYDDSRRTCYSAAGSKTNSVDREANTVPDTRIYSSSYPGTTSSLSTESGGGDESGGMLEAGSECILLTVGGMDSGSQEEILYSHDDLSHDSYELLERDGEEEGDDEQEDDDEGRETLRRRVKSYSGTRSCSLESDGDILPMDEIDEMSRIGQDNDMAVFQMDEIDTVGSQTYIKQRGTGSGLENVINELQSTNTDINERKGLDLKLDDRNVIRESPQFDSNDHTGFDDINGSKTIRGLGNMSYVHSVLNTKVTAENEDGLVQTRSSKEVQAHGANCKAGSVVAFESREEVLINGGRNIIMTHTPVERAKSDPHASSFRTKGGSKRKRRVLTHQKSIDVTPVGSGESDDEGEGDAAAMAMSRSEYNIPYTLHKRHAMNGTAPTQESAVPHPEGMLTDGRSVLEDEHDNHLSRVDGEKASDEKQIAPQQSSDSSGGFGVQTEVEKRVDAEDILQMVSSADASHDAKEITKVIVLPRTDTDYNKLSEAAVKPEFLDSAQMFGQTKSEICEKFLKEPNAVMPDIACRAVTNSDDECREKQLPAPRRSRMGPPGELPTGPLLPTKRDRSPILFARARLGLSEGSAFSPVRQVGSPASSRRAKSLDAPVVAVHRLPHAYAFSSNDDTLDNGTGKSEPLKPLEIIAKRLPSTIEDENDVLEDDKQDSLNRQLKWEPPEQTPHPLAKHTPHNIDDEVIADAVPDSSLYTHGLPSQRVNLKLSLPETASRDAVKGAIVGTNKGHIIYQDLKEESLSNKVKPVKSEAIKLPRDDEIIQLLPSPVHSDVTSHAEVYTAGEYSAAAAKLKLKPVSLKSLKVNEDTVKDKSDQAIGHVHDYYALKFVNGNENDNQGKEHEGNNSSKESHTERHNLESLQGRSTEIDARDENVSEKVTTRNISSAEMPFPDNVLDTDQELDEVLKEISGIESVSNVSCELDQHFKDKKRILQRDKDGSSGDYQAFDSIELPPEFSGLPEASVHPEAVAEELTNENRPTTHSYEYNNGLSSMSVQIHQATVKGSMSLKWKESECVLVPAEETVLPSAASQPETESKGNSVLDMEIGTPLDKEEGGIKGDTERISAEGQNIVPSPESQLVHTLRPDSSGTESNVFLNTEKDEISRPLLVSAILPDASLSEVARCNLAIPPAETEYQTVPSKDLDIQIAETDTAKIKAHVIEIVKIDSNSIEKEEAVATSDEEIPAIPMDEEGGSLERWVSVEDIHEELLAADYALKGALDLGHEFQYIDEDERQSPDTCSDYDNLSSASPSGHVVAQDTEPPLEQAEEFVEIELSKREGERGRNITGSEMSDDARASSENIEVISAQESDPAISSLSEIKEGSEEVKATVVQIVEEDKSLTHAERSSQSHLTVGQVVDGRVSTVLSDFSSVSQNVLKDQEHIKLSQEKECPEKLVDLAEQKAKSKDWEEQNQLTVEDNIELARQGEVASSVQEKELYNKSKMRVKEEAAVSDEKKDSSDTLKPERRPVMGTDSPESVKEGRDEESPESMKDDKVAAERSKSEEEASSSSSLALPARVELSSTWRPFLLESSGSSSLEEGFFPPDEEETTSSPSNNEREEAAASIEFPATFAYPCIGDVITSVGGYGGPGVFALSRTLSRISERSTTSEQERSDLDDDSTKPSSRSPSVDDESLLSSDHQPSLSSDPPSGGPTVDGILGVKPQDESTESDTPAAGPSPGNMFIPPPLLSDDDWPSPPTSSSLFETPVVSHVETFYMEIHPEEACKVLVVDSATDPTGGDGSSTDENHTLQDDDNDFLSGECLSSSATTLDGTVKVAVRPKCPSHYCAGSSLSEDTSMGLSLSEWSSSTSTIRPQCPHHYTDAKSDNTSLDDLGRSVPDIPTSSKMSPYRSRSPSYYSGAKSDTCLDDSSPTRLGKPPSGQKSRNTFYSASKSLTSVDTSFDDVPVPIMSSERPVKVVRPKCTPYYSTAHSDEGERMLERSVLRQGMVEMEPFVQNLESPAVWSNEESMSTHSVQQISGSKVKSKCYSYYSTAAAARSPQSDGDTSSSLDGSNVADRISRAPKRRKSQPKKRHRVTVDLEVRDGQIVEVSSKSAVETQSTGDQSQVFAKGTSVSTPTVVFVPKQSSV